MGAAPDSSGSAAREILPESHNRPVLVEAGTSFEGLLSCKSGVRVDGELKGDIIARGRIELGELSHVTGALEADEIVVAGRVEGSLVARRRIEVLATAEVLGDLCAGELLAEDGCTVRGNCRTGPSTP
jgi:cytoskeletal protein CcmA (bactofilin family)